MTNNTFPQFYNKTLPLEHLEGKYFRVTDYVYYQSTIPRKWTIVVPPGFVTDFASVPRMPLAYLLTGNTSHWEALIHDRLYRWGDISRYFSDQILLEAAKVRSDMRSNNTTLYKFGRSIRSHTMYAFVRSFGSFSFKQLPGCLDYRNCPSKNNEIKSCTLCQYYYTKWYDISFKEEE